MTDPTRQVRLELPRYDRSHVPAGPRPVWRALHGNSRAHWRTRARATRQVIDDVVLLARDAGLHRITSVHHLTVELVWAPGDHRRADADNLWPLLKVCCDALARGRTDLPGLHLVPDDTPAWMTKLAPRIQPPPDTGLWLDITVTT